jgi:hypothetical protein
MPTPIVWASITSRGHRVGIDHIPIAHLTARWMGVATQDAVERMDDVEHNNKQMLTPQSRPAADMAEKTRMQLSMYSLVAAVCSFVGMIMVFALVIVFANTNFDGDTKVHLWGTPAAPAPAPAPVHLMCASDQPVPASGLDGVALAYNNMGKDMLNGQAARRYEGMAAQLKPIGWHQGLLAEASDAGDRSELIADGMSGDVDFPHGNFQTILKPSVRLHHRLPHFATLTLRLAFIEGRGLTRCDGRGVQASTMPRQATSPWACRTGRACT